MPGISYGVEKKTLGVVAVCYINAATAKWWNRQRKTGEVCTFTGWYWTRGTTEGGPFKTRSAAIRDAYYIVVLRHNAAPSVVRAAAEHDSRPARPTNTHHSQRKL